MSTSPRAAADFYDLLGVDREASTDEIKKRFRKLARECHPDVAKDDPQAAARFGAIREAYETLADPIRRSRYDRRGQRVGFGPGGSWRPPGNPGGFGGSPGFAESNVGVGHGARRREKNLDLEDIFDDFGGMTDFGFKDGVPPPHRGRAAHHSPHQAPQSEPSTEAPSGGRATEREPGRSGHRSEAKPLAGRDISLHVDVPERVAGRGGTLTLHYPRLRRAEDGLTLYRYDEIYDLKVPPGTIDRSTIRIERMGDAGASGGPYGDLVCEVRVVRPIVGEAAAGRTDRPPHKVRVRAPGAAPNEPAQPPRDGPARSSVRPPPTEENGSGSRSSDPTPAAEPAGQASNGSEPALEVPISVSEALLGGRVEVETPGGRVRVVVPPCTSSGTRLRLKSRGPDGKDLLVALRIVVPRELDPESRALIEEFARLNSADPRRS